MFAQLRSALVLIALFSLLTGLVYPAVVTAIAQTVFPAEAGGSLVEYGGQVVGSRLIGQHFDDPRYFWGRPSATSPHPYNAAASAGSNLGPTNPALLDAVRVRIAALGAADSARASLPIPVDLVTTSASGLDPHVSPAAARYQIDRVARQRGLPEAQVRALVEAHCEDRTLGLLGEPRVNVLLLNLALDALTREGA